MSRPSFSATISAKMIMSQALPDLSKFDCPHWGVCGGCKLYELSYEEQLDHKTQRVEQKLSKFEVTIEPIIPAPNVVHYRNKIEFTFFPTEDGQVGCGFHEKGSFHRLVNLQNCLLTPTNNMDLLTMVRDWANEEGLTAYNKKTHQGLLRYLIIRDSWLEKTKLIILVTQGGTKSQFLPLAERLRKHLPMAGLIWSNQPDIADAVKYTNPESLFGTDYLTDSINGFSFRVPFNSFFQVHNDAATVLYKLIEKAVTPGGNILDLFCGAGTISINLAGNAASVMGVELIPEAIETARLNAELNKVPDLVFQAARVREWMSQQPIPADWDTVILDPPRSGTDKKTMRHIGRREPKEIIYVACGMDNLAYNLTTVMDFGYKIESIQPLDMFPWTPHVEVVIKLVPIV